MSAIAGIFFFDERPVDRAVLDCMVEKLAHRGPDGVGVWQAGPVGLGHRLLWNTPESLLEQQPYQGLNSALTITADARIDNREYLYNATGIYERSISEVTDALLILRSYEKWGESCVEHFEGDFAFALWDKSKQQLFCARDHFGVKPFYYYLSQNVFVFATEIKALFCSTDVPQKINEIEVAYFLNQGISGKTSTLFQNVLRLPPAHSMVVKKDSSVLHRYWQLDPEREIRLASEQEYADILRTLFTNAVQRRLRSAFPVGSMLSGGLDSSSIACVAQGLLAQSGRGKLRTYSALHDKILESDEREFIHAVLASGNYDPYYLHADDVSPLVDLEHVLWHLDEASQSGNLYINWCMYQAAEKHGVRVILDGFDGDNAISHGLGLLTELANAGRWMALSREVIAYSNKTNKPWLPALQAWFYQYGFRPLISKAPGLNRLSGVSRTLLKRTRKPVTPSANQWSVKRSLRQDFVQRIGFDKLLQARAVPPRTDREKQHQTLNGPGLPYALETLNRCAGAFSVEVRFPFFDKQLVEFCLAVPAEQKMNQGWTRMIMRRAMAGILPHEVQWRGGKANLQPSFEHNLLAFEHERLDRLIRRPSLLSQEYLDISYLQNALARYELRNATVDEVDEVFNAATLALWLEHRGLTA